MMIWIIIGWVVLFATCAFVASALYDVAKSSRLASRQLAATGYISEGPLPAEQPVFIQGAPRFKADAVVKAAFSQIPSLHYHTLVDAYYSRKKTTVVDRTETAAFQIAIGDQWIDVPTSDAPITWLAAQVNAYHGLVGRLAERERDRLVELGVDSSAMGGNPLRAISVEEDLFPLGDHVWVYGKITQQAVTDAQDSLDTPARPALLLESPSEHMQAIIAMSAEDLAQQLRYQFIINLSAAVFIAVAPVFFLAISLIR